MIGRPSWHVRTPLVRPVKRQQLRGTAAAQRAYEAWKRDQWKSGDERQAALGGWGDYTHA